MHKWLSCVHELKDPLEIREPKKEEIDTLIDIYDQAIRGAFVSDGYEDVDFDILQELNLKRDQLTEYFDAPSCSRHYYIGLLQGKIIGTINFGPLGKETRENVSEDFLSQGELGGLYILPSYQNMGYGSALINYLLAWMQAEDIQYFSLDSGYKSAQKKWLNKFGQPYKILKDYWDKGADHMIWLCQVNQVLK